MTDMVLWLQGYLKLDALDWLFVVLNAYVMAVPCLIGAGAFAIGTSKFHPAVRILGYFVVVYAIALTTLILGIHFRK